MACMKADTEKDKTVMLLRKRESRRRPFLPGDRVVFVTSYLLDIRTVHDMTWQVPYIWRRAFGETIHQLERLHG